MDVAFFLREGNETSYIARLSWSWHSIKNVQNATELQTSKWLILGTREMAQWLRAGTTLVEEPGLTPSPTR